MHLHNIPLIIGAVALTSLTAPALAGGIGVMGAAGVHQERADYYDEDENHFYEDQMRPNYGTGLYVMLGDRDDRVQGSMKIYWQADAPPTTELNNGRDPDFVGDEISIALRQDDRNIGIATAGIQWSLVGDPSAFSFNLITNIGAAAITPDLTEFAYAEIGPGVSYALDSSIQFFGEALYQPRWRKGLSHGAGGAVGVRYLFD